MQDKYYDPENNRLIYIYKKATPDYWDQTWEKELHANLRRLKVSKWNYVIGKTKKFLPYGASVLEGGCGTGIQVFKLHEAGFKTTGLDYSPGTIHYLKENYPELDIRYGDVREIPFEDDSFDGYWSFGVIEHFYEGYSAIVSEMYRVIKPGKYLFLAFPHMSTYRRKKAGAGKYPAWNHDPDEIENFFQFALDEDRVIPDIEDNGFSYIEKKKLSGLSGFRDESGPLFSLIDKIYNCKLKFIKPFKTLISIALTPYFSNSILLIFKKKENGGK